MNKNWCTNKVFSVVNFGFSYKWNEDLCGKHWSSREEWVWESESMIASCALSIVTWLHIWKQLLGEMLILTTFIEIWSSVDHPTYLILQLVWCDTCSCLALLPSQHIYFGYFTLLACHWSSLLQLVSLLLFICFVVQMWVFCLHLLIIFMPFHQYHHHNCYTASIVP